MTNALETHRLTKVYDDNTVLSELSLAIKPGEFVTLLGPSGCGKTTTLRLVAGFDAPDGGSIVIQGETVADVHQSTPPDKRRVGMVFQEYALFPHLSVADNIAFGLRGRRDAKASRVETMLTLVGLEGLGGRMPHALSGGQQQRVALARALAPEPTILLLDEPFSNLDAALRKQVRGEVQQILRQTGTTSIFVTHDQEEALSLSDRVAVLFDGVLHQYDTPERIYNAPMSLPVASFIGEANFLPAQAEGTRARCALGDVRLFQPAQGEVMLLIRPEILHLMTTDEGVSAEVSWREYYGHNQRIGLKLADGSELITRTDAQIVYKRGQQVRVSVYAPLLAFEQRH